MAKKNGATEPEAEYLAAVEEGKAITETMSGKQWALGDLADKVEKAYGESRLAQYATDINFPGAVCTLERCRDVCRAFPKSRGRPRFFASAQVLATHPNRSAIVERNPDISKAEARELMRQWNATKNPSTTAADQDEDDEPDDDFEDDDTAPTSSKALKAKAPKKSADAVQADAWATNLRKWQSDVVETANKAIELAATRKRSTPEQRRKGRTFGGITKDGEPARVGECCLAEMKTLYTYGIYLAKHAIN